MGRASSAKDQWKNLRMELCWNLKRIFDEGGIHGVDDELLRRQLLSLRWWVHENGVKQMESKKEMEDRGVPSPDRADALVLAFACYSPRDAYADDHVTYEPEPEFVISPL